MQCQKLNNNSNYTWFSCPNNFENTTVSNKCKNIFEHDFFYIVECIEVTVAANNTATANNNTATATANNNTATATANNNTVTATANNNTVAANNTATENNTTATVAKSNNTVVANNTVTGNNNTKNRITVIQYNRTGKQETLKLGNETLIISIVGISSVFCIIMCFFFLKVVCKNRKRKLRRRSSRTVAPEHIEIQVNTPETKRKKKGKYLKIKENAPNLTVEKQVLATIEFMIKHLELQDLRKQKHNLLKQKNKLPASKVSLAKVAQILKHKKIKKQQLDLRKPKHGMTIKEIFDSV